MKLRGMINFFSVDLQLLTMYLHCKQWKGYIGLSDESATILLEVKVAASVTRLEVQQH